METLIVFGTVTLLTVGALVGSRDSRSFDDRERRPWWPGRW